MRHAAFMLSDLAGIFYGYIFPTLNKFRRQRWFINIATEIWVEYQCTQIILTNRLISAVRLTFRLKNQRLYFICDLFYHFILLFLRMNIDGRSSGANNCDCYSSVFHLHANWYLSVFLIYYIVCKFCHLLFFKSDPFFWQMIRLNWHESWFSDENAALALN